MKTITYDEFLEFHITNIRENAGCKVVDDNGQLLFYTVTNVHQGMIARIEGIISQINKGMNLDDLITKAEYIARDKVEQGAKVARILEEANAVQSSKEEGSASSQDSEQEHGEDGRLVNVKSEG